MSCEDAPFYSHRTFVKTMGHVAIWLPDRGSCEHRNDGEIVKRMEIIPELNSAGREDEGKGQASA